MQIAGIDAVERGDHGVDRLGGDRLPSGDRERPLVHDHRGDAPGRHGAAGELGGPCEPGERVGQELGLGQFRQPDGGAHGVELHRRGVQRRSTVDVETQASDGSVRDRCVMPPGALPVGIEVAEPAVEPRHRCGVDAIPTPHVQRAASPRPLRHVRRPVPRQRSHPVDATEGLSQRWLGRRGDRRRWTAVVRRVMRSKWSGGRRRPPGVRRVPMTPFIRIRIRIRSHCDSTFGWTLLGRCDARNRWSPNLRPSPAIPATLPSTAEHGEGQRRALARCREALGVDDDAPLTGGPFSRSLRPSAENATGGIGKRCATWRRKSTSSLASLSCPALVACRGSHPSPAAGRCATKRGR